MSSELGDSPGRDTSAAAGANQDFPQYSALNFAVTAVVAAIILLALLIMFAHHR